MFSWSFCVHLRLNNHFFSHFQIKLNCTELKDNFHANMNRKSIIFTFPVLWAESITLKWINTKIGFHSPSLPRICRISMYMCALASCLYAATAPTGNKVKRRMNGRDWKRTIKHPEDSRCEDEVMHVSDKRGEWEWDGEDIRWQKTN